MQSIITQQHTIENALRLVEFELPDVAISVSPDEAVAHLLLPGQPLVQLSMAQAQQLACLFVEPNVRALLGGCA